MIKDLKDLKDLIVITIIDDEQAAINILKDKIKYILKEKLKVKYSILTFLSVEDALEYLENIEIDILITDFNIGDTHPHKLLKTLNGKYSYCIGMSGNPELFEHEAIKDYIDLVLVKNISVTYLEYILRNLVKTLLDYGKQYRSVEG